MKATLRAESRSKSQLLPPPPRIPSPVGPISLTGAPARRASSTTILNQMVKDNSLDATFGALSDPTRRAIVQRLTRGEASVGELAEPFDISLPAISKHLTVLEEAGLLVRTKEGRNRRCRLLEEPMREALEWIATYGRFWEGQLDSLERFLAESKGAGSR
jgi:DNA-binding transcriptional ArsR family regulator